MTINTLYELARNSVEKFASKVAFSMFEGDDVTYAEVGRRIAKVQEILTGAGLQAGDKAALLSSNMPNWGVCYFAVTSAGMIAVPILPDFSGEELDMIIEHSEARALLVSDKLFTKLSKETIGRLNVVVRTKNLGVIAQQVHAQGSTAVPKTRRSGGHHLYFGNHVQAQGRDADPFGPLRAGGHFVEHLPRAARRRIPFGAAALPQTILVWGALFSLFSMGAQVV